MRLSSAYKLLSKNLTQTFKANETYKMKAEMSTFLLFVPAHLAFEDPSN